MVRVCGGLLLRVRWWLVMRGCVVRLGVWRWGVDACGVARVVGGGGGRYGGWGERRPVVDGAMVAVDEGCVVRLGVWRWGVDARGVTRAVHGVRCGMGV